MNVRPPAAEALAALRAARSRTQAAPAGHRTAAIDVTVSDGGVRSAERAAPASATTRPAAVRPAPSTAAAEAAAPARDVEAAAPTSAPELAATLSLAEQEALTSRFAQLPRDGVTTGGYDMRGRATGQAPTSRPGGLLDVTA